MCGISGIYQKNDPNDMNFEIIGRMLSSIKHRGPDETGVYLNRNITFGSVRLSIIDLLNGHQPMESRDGRYCLVFNGEIFNYKELRNKLQKKGINFRTTSDTEVLLYSLITWSEAALTFLNGQYAFAFYDSQDDKLLLARDRFGERPLFYYKEDDLFVFSSEIKGILQHPTVTRELDELVVSDIFTNWTAVPGYTCFKNIYSVLPGHYITYRKGKLDQKQYYTIKYDNDISKISFEDAKTDIRNELLRSVRCRLNADVPVGVYLSGGLDSSIVTALACQESSSKVKSYAVQFENREYDESSYQKRVADYLGTDHNPIIISDKNIIDTFPSMVLHAETVQFRSAAVPMYLLAKHVHSDDIKVVLTGEGSDELFLGYDIYKETLFRINYHLFVNDNERDKFISKLYPYIPLFNEAKTRQLNGFFSNFTNNTDDLLFSHKIRFSLGLFAKRLLVNNYKGSDERLGKCINYLFKNINEAPVLNRAQIIEYLTLLEGYLLSSQGDRMTSAHGVEGRSPFLDHKLVEHAIRLPVNYKLKDNHNEKYILKEIYKTYLPEEVINRPKQPYRAPDCKSFINHKSDTWMNEILSDENIKTCGLFDADKVSLFINNLFNKSINMVTPKEDQAFMLLLSSLVLYAQMIKHHSYFRPLQRTDYKTLINRVCN